MKLSKKERKRQQEFIQNPQKSLESIGRIIMNKAFRIGITDYFDDPYLHKTDLSSLTAQEMIDKMNEFLNSKPKPQDESYPQFLFYLTHFPVSMCKRTVSKKLKYLIGFHYRLGIPQKKHEKNINPVSMEELAEVFGRSKATIHECVEGTKESWSELEKKLYFKENLREKAERELIEEEKARLLKEREAQALPEQNE